MNIVNLLSNAAKYIGAAIGGGATALAGALGASILGKSAANIIGDILDYTIFNVEGGYFKDFPERKDENALKRIWRVYHD